MSASHMSSHVCHRVPGCSEVTLPCHRLLGSQMLRLRRGSKALIPSSRYQHRHPSMHVLSTVKRSAYEWRHQRGDLHHVKRLIVRRIIIKEVCLSRPRRVSESFRAATCLPRLCCAAAQVQPRAVTNSTARHMVACLL